LLRAVLFSFVVARSLWAPLLSHRSSDRSHTQFVLDVANAAQVPLAMAQLAWLLDEEALLGKPFLIVLNKADLLSSVS
jgi:hypothetical protein